MPGQPRVSPDQLPIGEVLSEAAGRVVPVGRHERALSAAAAAAAHIATDPARYAAGLSLAQSLARALDVAEAKLDTLTASQSARAYTELLDRLGLLPVVSDDDRIAPGEEGTRAGPGDPLAGFGRPEVVHPAVA